MEHPERYVLKPMKECGGNNLFGDRMVRRLNIMMTQKQSPSAQYALKAFILQQRIHPPQFQVSVQNQKWDLVGAESTPISDLESRDHVSCLESREIYVSNSTNL